MGNAIHEHSGQEDRHLLEKDVAMEEYRDQCPCADAYLPEAFVSYDSDAKIQGVSSSFEAIFGWTTKEIQGRRIPYVVPNLRSEVMENLQDQIDGRPEPFQAKGLTKQGKVLDIFISGSGWKDSDGDAAGFLAVIRPVTEEGNLCGTTYSASLKRALRIKTKEVEALTTELDRTTSTCEDLRRTTEVVVETSQQAAKDLERRIINNYQLTVVPILGKLKQLEVTMPERYLLEALDVNIRSISSSFGTAMARSRASLTPRQMEICKLILSGKRSRDIAQKLGLSTQTVIVHRKNIRKKLGLKHKGQNLSAYIRKNM